MWIGPRKGDTVYGDLFDQWAGREEELLTLMNAKVIADAKLIWERGFIQAPWSNDEFLVSKDHAKLMVAIQDAAGCFQNDIEEIRLIMGFKAITNAKAVVNATIRKGFVKELDGLLSLTLYGRDMLDELEDPSGDFYMAA